MGCQLLSTAELIWSTIKIHNKEIHSTKNIFFQPISDFAMGCCHGPVGGMRDPHTCREQDLKVQSISVHGQGGTSPPLPRMTFEAMQGKAELQPGPGVTRDPNEFRYCREMELRCPLSAWCERERQEQLPPCPARMLLPGLCCVLGYCTRDASRCRRVL